MTLWFVFALMTAAAIFAVLLPLGLSGRAQIGGSETTVYKDQLAEIDRDLAAGLIGSAEAEAARIEIGRRLLAGDGTLHVVGRLKPDDWQGRSGVQFEIEDAADPRVSN